MSPHIVISQSVIDAVHLAIQNTTEKDLVPVPYQGNGEFIWASPDKSRVIPLGQTTVANTMFYIGPRHTT